MRAMFAAVAIMALPGWGLAQNYLPPVAPGPGDGPPLPNGTAVSQPLTPLELPPVVVDPKPVAEVKPEGVQRVEDVQNPKHERRGPLGPGWDDMEYLMWWPKAAPVPPLATGTRTGALPVLGGANTSLLVGGHALDNQDISGGRFTLGWALNNAETVGYELRYLFLGTRTNRVTVRDFNNPRVRALGVPYLNALTGLEDVFVTGAPGVATGSIYATTTTRMQGAEANAVANLYDSKNFKLNGTLGYRFLQLNEGLTVEQARYSGNTFGPIYDEFSTSNRFHGGQLGVHADLSKGIVYCEFTGKVALGRTFEVLRIDGATGINTPGPNGLAMQRFAGGVFAQPSNMGRYTHGTFAVIPEGTLKLGLKLSDVGRLYVGYNFMYLSDAIRPGDQIDRTINPMQVAALNPGGAGAMVLADRPRPMMSRTDFWVQGLIIGLETRY